MKVLKNNFKSEWPKKVACKGCSSELIIDKEDVKTSYDQRDNWSETYINCPCCNKGVSFRIIESGYTDKTNWVIDR